MKDLKYIAYDFVNHCACLVMQEGHVADMDSAARLCELLDPDVEQIHTFSGSEKGAVYERSTETHKPEGARK